MISNHFRRLNKPLTICLSPSLLPNTELKTPHGKLYLIFHRYKYTEATSVLHAHQRGSSEFDTTTEAMYSVTICHSKTNLSRQCNIRIAERTKWGTYVTVPARIITRWTETKAIHQAPIINLRTQTCNTFYASPRASHLLFKSCFRPCVICDKRNQL